MKDERLEKLADVLVNYSTKVKKRRPRCYFRGGCGIAVYQGSRKGGSEGRRAGGILY